MVTVDVFYSVRKDSKGLPVVAFFSDKHCAELDQQYFNYWDEPRIGSFKMDVTGGVVYIDVVMTREQYVEELNRMSPLPTELIAALV